MGIFFNRKKRAAAGGSMELMGMPGDLDTHKALLTARERDIDIEFKLLDMLAAEERGAEYRALSPLGKTPCLREGEFVTAGASAVMTYLDARAVAKSPSLNPKKAAHLGLQNTWSETATRYVGPAAQTLMRECVLGPMRDASKSPDETALRAARADIGAALERLDAQLEGNQFIAGPYSFADVHWTVYLHACGLCGYGELADAQANVKAWYRRVMERKNPRGKPTFAALPGLDEIKARQIPPAA